MINKRFTRRIFISRLLAWLGSAALICMLPSFLRRSTASPQKEFPLHLKDLSLREMAEKKLHHSNPRFINPFNPFQRRRFLDVVKWKFSGAGPFEELYSQEQIKPVSIDWEPVKRHKGLSVTFINHSSLLVRDRGTTFLIDPVFFGLRPLYKDFTPLQFDPASMPTPDHILITHGHYDHLDKNTLKIFDRNSHVITPLGYNSTFKSLKMRNRTQMDWYDTYDDGSRSLVFLPANHWTMRNPITGPNRSLWGSYLLRTASGPTLYFSGDTAWFNGFHDIGKEFDIDLAVFNMGAYEPRWFMRQSHINPAETLSAFEDLGARKLIAVHWGTFRLGDEPVFKPPLDLAEEAEKRRLTDRIESLTHGQTLYL